jgi:cysteine synthase A
VSHYKLKAVRQTVPYRPATTPLVPVQLRPGDPVVWAKLEFLNPSGSTKDRIARFILEKARREGHLDNSTAVIEASSGSTSIAMALVCAQLGVRFIAVMPEGVSNERTLMIRAFGGEIRLTPAAGGIFLAIQETERLAEQMKAFLPKQFANEDNALAHRTGTAREILEQLPSKTVDAVVSGVGTGGTLVGICEGLAEAGCTPLAILAKPITFSGEIECCSFSGKIPGVVDSISTIFREGRLPRLETIEVEDRDALAAARDLGCLGFPVGPSSGLNYRAAVDISRKLGKESAVVTVFPDRMERYFTTDLFAPHRNPIS